MAVLEEVVLYAFQQCVYYVSKVPCHVCLGPERRPSGPGLGPSVPPALPAPRPHPLFPRPRSSIPPCPAPGPSSPQILGLSPSSPPGPALCPPTLRPPGPTLCSSAPAALSPRSLSLPWPEPSVSLLWETAAPPVPAPLPALRRLCRLRLCGSSPEPPHPCGSCGADTWCGRAGLGPLPAALSSGLQALYVCLPALLECPPFQSERRESWSAGPPLPEELRRVVAVYQAALDLLRRLHVHPEVAAQVLAYLFFFSGTLLLNQLLDKGEGGRTPGAARVLRGSRRAAWGPGRHPAACAGGPLAFPGSCFPHSAPGPWEEGTGSGNWRDL